MEKDRCVIIVKAQPHRSSKYSETVCAAGVGEDGRWRRQYPVPYRILNNSHKFKRWEWIRYEYRLPKNDRRKESQKVVPNSIVTDGTLRSSERGRLLAPLILRDFSDADDRGKSLTLVRPRTLTFEWIPKSAGEVASERDKHANLARQLSFFDTSAKPLEPCPSQFFADWTDQAGLRRRHECDDWESSAAFSRFRREYGEDQALLILKEKYEVQYLNAGLALAFSTHSRRNVTFQTRNQ